VPTFLPLATPTDVVAYYDKFKFPKNIMIEWTSEKNRFYPDHWVVERKTTAFGAPFEVIGSTYLRERFYDTNIENNKMYIYRVTAYDNMNRKAESFLTARAET
jgi:hypothetical protein